MREMKDSGIEWIGQIPADWKISKIKYVSDFAPSCSFNKIKADDLITYSPMDCIKQGFYIPFEKAYKDLPNSLTPFQDGDIVMAKVTPCFENGNIAIMQNLSSGLGLGSSELFVFRTKNINTKYLFYWLQNYVFIQRACSTMTGAGGLKRVSSSFCRNCDIHLPPEQEQQAIADFLDAKCEEIDELSDDIQSQIDNLEQYKRSLILETVTKGLDPNVPMKDSGLKWLGKIPANWMKCKIKHVCSLIGSGTTPSSHISSFYDGDIFWIQSGDLYGNTLIRDTSKKLTQSALHSFPVLKIYKAPFIVMAMYCSGSIGNIAISLVDACVNQATCCLKADDSVHLKFMYYWLNACKHELLSMVSGGVQQNISQIKIKNQTIFVPNIKEQQAIADFLDAKCQEIDEVVATKREQLNVLADYKKALIFEYVTGKKEVACHKVS